ncbi:MAG: hypothetical protein ACRDHL_04940, partial [Candidatus Promineifilaceae bacterium]
LRLSLAGEAASGAIGWLKLAPRRWPALAAKPAAELDGVELVWARLEPAAAEAGDTVRVAVRWQARRPPGRDLTTFLHLGDPQREPLAQADGPPLDGDYPTGLWAAGEVIDDSYALVVPAGLAAGRYPVTLGLYEPTSGARVPLWVGGARQAHDAYLVGWLTVGG